MKFGVQIFGCLADCKKNPQGFFEQLAKAGYRQIEPCVLFDDPREMLENARKNKDEFTAALAHNIWKPEELPEYLRLMEQYGLTLSSVHVFASDWQEASKLMIDTAIKNKITSYVVNCNREAIEHYENFAAKCKELSRKLGAHNIELWIHNGGTEIKTTVEHKGHTIPVLSAILDECEKQVGTQIDVGWVLYGGIDPVTYLKEVKDYVRSIHFKDLKKDFADRKDGDIFACLGEGALNVKDILNAIPITSD